MRDTDQFGNGGVLRAKQSSMSKQLIGLAAGASLLLGAGCASQQAQQQTVTPVAQTENATKATDQTEQEVQKSREQKVTKADAMMASLGGDATNDVAEKQTATKQPKVIEEEVVRQSEKASASPEPVVEASAPAQNTEQLETEVDSHQAHQVAVAKTETAPEAQESAQPEAPKQEQRSAADKAAAAVASLAAPQKKLKVKGKAFDVSRADLPVSHGIWKIKRGEALLDKDIVISTPTWEMGKAGYMSQIWVTVMDDRILVNSSSDIDSKPGETGVRIDGGELIPFSKIEGNNIGVLEGDWLDTLAAGKQLEFFMGFFPDREPRSETFRSDVSLEGMSRIVPTYRNLMN